MIEDLWNKWQQDWRSMEALARRRGWDISKPLSIAPPASAAEIDAVGKKAGVAFPIQLREVLTEYSAAVEFGWYIPEKLRPDGHAGLPVGSTMWGHIWDLADIRDQVIASFLWWKEYLAHKTDSEQPNTPEMWENQFPLAVLMNGDFLTIDVSNPDGPQPVRYFSHELEGLHGRALAPDFFSFVTVLSQLGWAGMTHDDWFDFVAPEDGDRTYLSPEAEGSRRWLAWLTKDQDPDEPPPPIYPQSPAEDALLKAAEANSVAGVTAALDAGARPDVVRGEEWMSAHGGQVNASYATAVTYAARNSNIPLLEILVARGASLNTHRLALSEAVGRGSLETVRWLIAHGARVNGWKGQGDWPITSLQERRGREDFRTVLEALLQAGADPNAYWSDGTTMLMLSGPETAQLLLSYGADIHQRDMIGRTALHVAVSAPTVRLLVSLGLDVNTLSTHGEYCATTPLQAQLYRRHVWDSDLVPTLMELGADPKLRDGNGNNTLAHCSRLEDFETMRGFDLDPFERIADGGTLLHGLADRRARVMTVYGALFRHLLKLGVDINAVDDHGRTVLHVMTRHAEAEDIEEMLAAGADKSMRNRHGMRAFDYALRSQVEVRKLLE